MTHQQLIDRYTYEAEWSSHDELYVARVAEWPSLTAHGSSSEAALEELRTVVEFAIQDCEESGAPYPLPPSLTVRTVYSASLQRQTLARLSLGIRRTRRDLAVRVDRDAYVVR